ncbi:binder of sperm protein homolog 2-like isoform X2 [Peromyscus maniculatus bairdii]|uniref:binder of sperm protein homolog 2-like isoform X2 n=1 Tax=Peromyscus maniculatus bairdii TaxID=230844 RepID=UPI003FD50315
MKKVSLILKGTTQLKTRGSGPSATVYFIEVKSGTLPLLMGFLLSWTPFVCEQQILKEELISHLHPPKQEISVANCVFPFIYGDELHFNCISTHSDFDWCSLDFHFKGRWRYCTALDPPICVFPFQFRKKAIYECTKEGYILNRSWCSLTDNYNKDKKWKQCSPHK